VAIAGVALAWLGLRRRREAAEAKAA